MGSETAAGIVVVITSVVDATIDADVDFNYGERWCCTVEILGGENHLFGLRIVPNDWFSVPTMLSPTLSLTSLLMVTVPNTLAIFGLI